MKSIILNLFLILLSITTYAQTDVNANSPDGKVKLNIKITDGTPYYNISYAGNEFLGKSPLGLVSSVGDFSKNLKLVSHVIRGVKESYTLNRSKIGRVNYQANELKCGYVNAANDTIFVVFRLTNTDAAFSYLIPQNGKGKISCTIEKETTGFNLPAGTTTFITPQATAGIGYEHSKPSYEEEYTREEPVGSKSTYGLGYTFPALFHLGNKRLAADIGNWG
ncbi:MAG: glycoside hydrolase family 97 protein [Mucilaginibacter sp.]|nr:glycoside hydrolase family 97 protein [Mucilaginibacter sp.]